MHYLCKGFMIGSQLSEFNSVLDTTISQINFTLTKYTCLRVKNKHYTASLTILINYFENLYYMNKLTILRDVLIGGILAGIFSYFTSLYDERPELLKITAFMWGTPLIFFYILFISWKGGENAVKDLTFHGLLGILITVFAMILTLYIYELGKIPSVLINLFILGMSICLYIKYKIYKL